MCPRLVVRLAVALSVALAASAAPAQEPTKNAKAAAPAAKAVDLNTATAEQLLELPGIGEATAKKIIDGRPFASLEDLKGVGIPERTIEKLRTVATVTPARAATPAAKAATTRAMDRAEKAKEAKEEKAAAAGTAIDLNTADEAALLDLPGIGPATARAIIAARPFGAVGDLERVKGLGPAKIAALQGRVKVTPGATPTPTPVPTTPVAAEPKSATPKGKAANASAKAKAATVLAPGERININTASKEELDRLPGIGPVRAQAIINGRPFKAIEDIKTVKGIKDVEFGKIQGMISVK